MKSNSSRNPEFSRSWGARRRNILIENQWHYRRCGLRGLGGSKILYRVFRLVVRNGVGCILRYMACLHGEVYSSLWRANMRTLLLCCQRKELLKIGIARHGEVSGKPWVCEAEICKRSVLLSESLLEETVTHLTS